ncbi:low molecular weight phosphotyrosine protein phosphatase [Pseudonocardia sp. S2-4]|uniref:protein-tyrosine-phosphatase n=1 Tax=Pseudonocardia humida TaxID=2800819 RepID=A0ABT1AD43_9PSEU|nr:low molecular weight phosphotyrosine protein phosphatase [Pseudonocardia humida]
MLSIVFVCTGNICRSPIAEKVFVHELERAGLADRVKVSSAGTTGWHVGSPADERASALLRAEGYVVTHAARLIDAEQLGADLLVALDHEHRRSLQALVPEPARVRLLRSFDPDAPPGAEVPDPYYADDAAFGAVLAMVRAAVPGLVDWVRENS